MAESFIFSINAVAPVVIMVVIGYLLGRSGGWSQEFFAGADKLVFRVALPVFLYNEVRNSQIGETWRLGLPVFCVIGTLVIFLFLCLIVPVIIKKKGTRGAFIQGVYRSNFAILGIALARSLGGEGGAAATAFVLPFVIPVYNILAVIVLSVNAEPGEGESVKKPGIASIAADIAKNRLIIAILLGIATLGIMSLFEIKTFPAVADKTLNYLSAMSTPLALLSLGANLKPGKIKHNLGLVIPAAALKLIALPAAAVSAALLLGMRGAEVVVVFILFGSPTSVTSYIMAKNMHNDHELAGQITLLTTLCSAFTIFAGSFALRAAGVI